MIEVEIEADAWRDAVPGVEALVVQASEAALAATEGGVGDLTVLLADDARVRDLNARFRGKDAATNVLSFPAAESADGYLGDLALAYETCAREAGEQRKSLSAHLTHLVVHGVLHLRGLDHEGDDAAEAMEALERRVLAGLGVADPYALSDPADG